MPVRNWTRKIADNTQIIYAVSESGTRLNITEKVSDNKLTWSPDNGKWTVVLASYKTPMQKVKRAAPGSEGYVVNPYSIEALDHYLKDFDKAFANSNVPAPRCFFHDSFEYYGAGLEQRPSGKVQGTARL